MKYKKDNWVPFVDNIKECGRIHCNCTSPNVCIYTLTPKLIGTREYNLATYFDQPGIIISVKGRAFHTDSVHQVNSSENVREFLDRYADMTSDYFKVIVSPTRDFFCDSFEATFMSDYLRYTLNEYKLHVKGLDPAVKHLVWYLDVTFPVISDLIEHILFLDEEFIEYISKL